MPRARFALDGEYPDAPSTYELELEFGGDRCLYAFSVDVERVQEEELKYVPAISWRTLFRRSRMVQGIAWGWGVTPMAEVTGRELVLSRATLVGRPRFGRTGRGLTE